MTGILDTIDDATEGRCACGCGARLDPAGPSAWFVDERHQEAWAAKRAGQPPVILGGVIPGWPADHIYRAFQLTPEELGELEEARWLASRLEEEVTRAISNGLRTTAPDVEFTVRPLSIGDLDVAMAAVFGTPQDDAGPPYTHTFVLPAEDDDGGRIRGAVPSYTIIDEPYNPGFLPPSTPWLPPDTPGDRFRLLQALLAPTPDSQWFDVPWPPGAHQVRIYGGGTSPVEIGTLTPDPDGGVVMSSGRYAFTPALCPEHARQDADPMLRAIEARRSRNTGPPPRKRAPRRIDPRGNR